MDNILIFIIVITVSLLCFVKSYYVDDQITRLPGIKKQPNFRQYSGYLDAKNNRFLHYWFVESQRHPRTDPFVLWLNGGPGCSSVLGLLDENGPFTVQEGGHDLRYNPASWNLVSNVLYLESPAGVGYSYSTTGNVTTSDDDVTDQNFNSLMSFFSKFPEFKRHKIYLTGESYAGYYLPLLADRLLRVPSLDFQAFAIGNPLSAKVLNDNSRVYYAYYHGMIGEKYWTKLISLCCDNNATSCDFYGNTKTQCVSVVSKFLNYLYPSGIDPYNIYDNCGKMPVYYNDRMKKFVARMFFLNPAFYISNASHLDTTVKKVQKAVEGLEPSEVVGSLACDLNVNSIIYMNLPEVKKALHIHSNSSWTPCSLTVQKHYKQLYTDMTPMYKRVLASKKRVLIYDGDFDTTCNFLGNQWFLNRLGQKVKEERSPWYYKDIDGSKQLGGWTRSHENAVFATVRGAGHLVPLDKPFAAFHIFQRFLDDQPL